MESDTNLLPGFLLGRYRVETILAERTLGITTRAFDTRLKREVVIKALAMSPIATEEGSIRRGWFEAEVEAASRISFHSHIVPVLDLAVEDDNTHYLITEYLAGGALAAQMAHGPLPIAEALRITKESAHGLQAAHDADIVHCGIAPTCIFLAFSGRAKIGGFRNAYIPGMRDPRQNITRRVSTPLYLSPEQEALPGPATDQYSLGLVLFEMLTGNVYKQVQVPDVERQTRRQTAHVAALLTRMLARQPEDRYPSMNAVTEAIDVALNALALEPSPAGSLLPSESESAMMNGQREDDREPLSGATGAPSLHPIIADRGDDDSHRAWVRRSSSAALPEGLSPECNITSMNVAVDQSPDPRRNVRTRGSWGVLSGILIVLILLVALAAIAMATGFIPA